HACSSTHLLSSSLPPLPPPTSTLFPYTTLFRSVEATIDDVRAALASKQIACRALVDQYIKRIEAYDKSGPALNAVQTINRRALRSEEHTSELQSRFDLVCRLLLEKKKIQNLHEL